VLVGEAPVIANPGRRRTHSHDHKFDPSFTPSTHEPHWASFSASRIVFDVPSGIVGRPVLPNQNAMLFVWGYP